MDRRTVLHPMSWPSPCLILITRLGRPSFCAAAQPQGKSFSSVRMPTLFDWLVRADLYTPADMITALQLIFSPFETWEKITMAQRGFFWILCFYLLPLLLIALGVEGFLLNRWGEKEGELGYVIKVPVELAIRYGVAYLAILLLGILISAKFLALASQSFNVRTTYVQAFTLMAYGFGPTILARILDGIPQLNTWVCWVVGAAATVAVLYHGIGMVLRPDQTKGFGLYLMAIVIVVLVSGVAHFAAIQVLHGKMFAARKVQGPATALQGLALAQSL